jgi:type II secretory pathway component PulC
MPGTTKNNFDTKRTDQNQTAEDIAGFLKVSLTVLVVCSIGLLAYIFTQTFVFKQESFAPEGPQARETKEINAAAAQAPEVKAFSEYAQVIEKRDIFETPYTKESAAEGQEQAAPAAAVNLTGNYKLVGIVLDKTPQAVLEDLRNKNTLFLSVGENVEGAVLNKIEEGKVTFSYNGQLLEMTP